MKVKMNFFERALLMLAYLMRNLSFNIGWAIHKKYDSKGVYNAHTFDGRKNWEWMVFINEKES